MVLGQVARVAVPIAIGAGALVATKALLGAVGGSSTGCSMSLSELMKRGGLDGTPPPSSAAAALREFVPYVTNASGERVSMAQVLPERKVTVVHLLRRFK